MQDQHNKKEEEAFKASSIQNEKHQLNKEDQSQSKKQSEMAPADPLKQLRSQLQAMQFESELIDETLTQTKDLEQAVAHIISLLEAREQKDAEDTHKKVLILLARNDLKMGAGKIAAQCAHATLKAFQQANQRSQIDDPFSLTFIQWLQSGKEIITYKVNDETQLCSLLGAAQQKQLSTCFIRDAGRTQIAAGSSTVGAVGPCSMGEVLSLVTGLRRL